MVAEANVREARARYDQLREFAALDSRVTINNLLQAGAAWQASQGTAEQASRAYSIAEVRYREGISTQLELSDTRNQLAQALVNRAQAARNVQIARSAGLLPRPEHHALEGVGLHGDVGEVAEHLLLVGQRGAETLGGQAQAQSQASAQQASQQSGQQTQAATQQAQTQQSTTGIPPQ